MTTYNKIIKWVILAVVILCCLSVAIMLNLSSKHQEKVESISGDLKYFKEFSLQTVDGDTCTQEILKGHTVTVFNGWAPWCGPCTSEMPDLEKMYQKYKDQGVQVVGIVADYDTSKSDDYDKDISKVIKKTKVTYPILLADKKFHEEPFVMMNNSFPGTWAVAEDGTLIQFVSGGKSYEEWDDYFSKWVKGQK